MLRCACLPVGLDHLALSSCRFRNLVVKSRGGDYEGQFSLIALPIQKCDYAPLVMVELSS
jgi:hypothetical protein